MGFDTKELSKFSEAGRAISQATGIALEDWAIGEAGIILKQWAGATKVVKEDRVEVEARYRAEKKAFGYTNASKNAFRISINTGRRRPSGAGTVWWKNPRTGKFRKLTAGQVPDDATFKPAHVHFRLSDWTLIQQGAELYASTLAALKPMALKAVGLSRQSIIQIADQLGIALESVKGGGTLSGDGIAKARQALASDGRYYQNGRGIQEKTETSFFVELINGYPLITKRGMDRTLMSIVRGRVSVYEKNLRAKVFESATKTARAYPYISLN